MSAPLLLVDRDGTLVVEPPGGQIDSLSQLRLAEGVVPALAALVARGYRLVMVSNQDGLGEEGHPQARFDLVQEHLLDLLASQGIRFESVRVCPHRAEDGCGCRKPATGLVLDLVGDENLDRRRSAVVGDRDSDLELARRLGLRGFRVVARGDVDHSWQRVARRLLEGDRRGRVDRRTRETEVSVAVDLAGTSPVSISTGIGFFDHMLEQIGIHGGFALEIEARGDLQVDEHHTVEDVGLALGEALRRALGGKRGIARYGATVPMDESLARVALDLSGRPAFRFEGGFDRERVGALPTELIPHFFASLSSALGAAVQIEVRGENDHHRVEACFKGVGRALRRAVRLDGDQLPSSKGSL